MSVISFVAPVVAYTQASSGDASVSATTRNATLAFWGWHGIVVVLLMWLTSTRRASGLRGISSTTGKFAVAILSNIACGIVSMVWLCNGDIANEGAFQFLTQALVMVYLALWTPRWTLAVLVGVAMIGLTIPVGMAVKQPWFRSYYPIIQGSQHGVLLLLFALNLFWSSKRSGPQHAETKCEPVRANKATAAASG